MDPAKEKDIEDEYLSSLMDLNVNSKPLINMLTMLAEDNLENAPVIVRAVEKHLAKVSPDVKLPILYLIDSIVKNVGDKYKQLFAQNIVNMFCGVFEKVNEKVREKMFNLRQTWNEVFPQTKLYALDVKVNVMDNNWPITAKIVPKSVHVNPNFLKTQPPPNPEAKANEDLVNQMKAKERELLELKQRKIELELMVTKKKIAESEKVIRGVVPQMPAALMQPLNAPPSAIHPSSIQHIHPSNRMRIAPVNPALISSARSRDPRIRIRQNESTPSLLQHQHPASLSSVAKSLPRIPKLSQSNNNHKSSLRNSERDRDPRSRRNKEKEPLKPSKSSPASKDKLKSMKLKSGSSDDSSPRKKSEEEKKSSKNSSSSHRSHSRHHSSKIAEPQDVDLRVPMETAMKPDSTTSNNKDKLLTDLLNGENMKSSHELITSDENEEGRNGASAMGDVDLRFIEGGKKRSMSSELLESEPHSKKNRADPESLFGDVDLRTSNDVVVEKKPKIKEKADFEAVRAKLNATKEKAEKLRPGIKILDEFPQMPASENGTADLVRKILGRKEKNKEIVKEREPSPPSSNTQEEVVPIEVPSAVGPQPSKQSRFSPLDKEEKIDDVADLGNMTAADFRKSSEVPASLRAEKKRKGSKWSQPTWPMNTNTNVRPPTMAGLPTSSQNMMPQHFVNPWESNPTVMAMQAQSQMPLVVPQSSSHPILNNKMRTLRLDGTKDHLLRFYSETAVIFNDVGEPHDIKFSAGQSRVVIDDQFSVDLNFNEGYKTFFIDGTLHQIKFGSPTRELYIDQHFYECYFNNQPTQIVLNDKLRRVRIEGNAPEVKIGRKRNDLVLGLINVVIDAEAVVPVFLDTSVQYFEFKGKIFTLQFADFFLSVVINNEPFKVEFGGLPKNYTLNGQKHFIRFTGLPESVNPGRVNMRGMRRTNIFRNCISPPIPEPLEQENLDINQLVENNMRGENAPMVSMNNSLPPNVIPGIGNEAQGAPALGVPNLDINDLLKQLVANGIIGGSADSAQTSKPAEVKEKSPERVEEKRKPPPRVEERRNPIIPVLLNRPDTIKKRQHAIVDTLYSGIQCSSCGLRFPPEQTMKYSQHLDWHFRQNRRERDSKRRAHFRKWYYNQSDWIKYEEIEDLEDREKNFFETQQMESMQMDQGEDSSATRTNAENSAPISCPAGPDDVNRACDMCHDDFEQFFNEETEEWHLRSALKVDDKLYHPICYEDFKASLTHDESALSNSKHNEEEDDDDDIEMKDEVVVKQEVAGDVKNPETSTAEDDDDVIVMPTEEPVVTEIHDESDVAHKNDLNATDDDVMIQEPKIETAIVPDDDDEDYQPTTSSNELPFKIKEEPKDDGYDEVGNDEDNFFEVTASANDDLIDDAYTNSPKPAFQPAQDENALFDDSSLLMSPQNYEEHSRDVDDDSSRPDSSGPTSSAPKKPKIVLSSLAQSSLSNKNLNTNSNNVIEQNENSILDTVNKLDSNSVELQSETQKDQQPTEVQEEPEIEFQVKPSLQGIKFEKIKVPVKRGLENSGLCSIM